MSTQEANENVQVLVIEDNPDDITLMLRALKKQNLDEHVHVLRDGAAALDYFFRDRGTPKLIFLDLKLPKVDGLEVLRRLRADERTMWIPVVVVSSSREERDVVEGYKFGVSSYILKPITVEAVAECASELDLDWMPTE